MHPEAFIDVEMHRDGIAILRKDQTSRGALLFSDTERASEANAGTKRGLSPGSHIHSRGKHLEDVLDIRVISSLSK